MIESLLLWGTALSITAVLATAIGVPWAVRRLPTDYFSRDTRSLWRDADTHPLWRSLLAVFKNLFGGLLFVLGVIMLFTPGQGVLTILAGLLLMNFPGKYRLERWLVSRPGVMKTLNWLRRRRGVEDFSAPGDTGE